MPPTCEWSELSWAQGGCKRGEGISLPQYTLHDTFINPPKADDHVGRKQARAATL